MKNIKNKLTMVIIPLLIIYSIGITFTLGFKDVTNDKWYWEAVNYVTMNEIMTGYPDNTFRPDGYVTRAQLAQVSMIIDVRNQDSKNSIGDILNSAMSTVTIETDQIIASGVAIDEHLILTAYHVVSRNINETFSIYPYGSSVPFEGNVVKYDAVLDLALIQTTTSFEPIKISTTIPSVLDDAYVIGAPMGIKESFSYGKVSKEIVFIAGRTNVQYDMIVNHGNSGGAIINSNGELIGIVLSKVDEGDAIGLMYGAQLSDIVKFLK